MNTTTDHRKRLGQVFTPIDVARTLVRWSIRNSSDRMLDPSCGDGRFLACHRSSTGIELDPANVALARSLIPGVSIHCEDFFKWASLTSDRFNVAVGNPPFIRYQNFSGLTREIASQLTSKVGVTLSGLASSWTAFLVVSASMLELGGRMAFLIPAEIGHAPYARPVLEYLVSRFERVRIVAVREKIFSGLSEAVWLLFADGYGKSSDHIEFCQIDRFESFVGTDVPAMKVSLSAWRDSGFRLRKFLLPCPIFRTYHEAILRSGVSRLGELAITNIGYVSGANEFFHLKPSEAERLGIPRELLRVAIRRARQLPVKNVGREDVNRWIKQDEEILLLDLTDVIEIPPAVKSYLDSGEGQEVRRGYKCRNREPWYVVPDVRIPDGFLSYMSGRKPVLVANGAKCVCTNSVHAVFEKSRGSLEKIQKVWSHPLVELSCELEGHPLGGGMLKLEPKEASQVLIPLGMPKFSESEIQDLREATRELRCWRNYV